VETGATIKTVSKTYKGEVDGLLTVIEILAWEIVDLKPPKALLEKQKELSQTVAQPAAKKGGGMKWILIGGAVVAAGGAYFLLSGSSASPLPEPPTLPN